MASSKVNTSRFLAKGGTNAQARVGGVHVALPSGPSSSKYMPTGANKNSTMGSRMAGLGSQKAKDC